MMGFGIFHKRVKSSLVRLMPIPNIIKASTMGKTNCVSMEPCMQFTPYLKKLIQHLIRLTKNCPTNAYGIRKANKSDNKIRWMRQRISYTILG